MNTEIKQLQKQVKILKEKIENMEKIIANLESRSLPFLPVDNLSTPVQLTPLQPIQPTPLQPISCMHDTCPSCNGTGQKFDGSMCIHGISCPCPKCSITFS